MSIYKFIIRSLIHYRKQHISLFLGMTISAMVLTGALVIGDSIQYSLTRMVDYRLGKTRFTIAGNNRFVDSRLAGNLSQALKIPVTPVLKLQGIVIQPNSGSRINRAQIIGIDSTFNNFCDKPLLLPSDDEAVVGSSIANRLQVEPGDEILVRIQDTNPIPVNAPFARESAATIPLRLNVIAIATDEQLGNFNLGNDQAGVYNVYLSSKYINRILNLKSLANTILIARGIEKLTVSAIRDSVKSVWSLKDLGLSIVNRNNAGTFDLISNRIFINPPVEQVIRQAGIPHEDILTYLINDIEISEKHTPYSFASAIPSSMSGRSLNDNEVILNKWIAEDLDAKKGDSVKLSYFTIGPLRQLSETSHSFIVKDIANNTTVSIDSTLMPKFQGLSEVGNCRDWDAGVPIDLKRIRDKDEKYWDTYRGTPKVLLSIEAGRRLWKNAFGSLTTIRFRDSLVSPNDVESVIISKISPSEIGLQVTDVRNAGFRAAKNAVDFTELFLGMSFFIIVAGILLTVLIYRLHFNRRSQETALLSGLGFGKKLIIRLRLTESSMVILTGSVAGSLISIFYNYALIAGLNTVWNDIVRTNMLKMHINPSSILLGAGVSMIVAIIPVYWVTVKRLNQSIAAQMKGYAVSKQADSRKKYNSKLWGSLLLIISILLVIYAFSINAIDNATLYLTSSALFLSGVLFLVHDRLNNKMYTLKNNVPTIGQLAVKNLQRNPSRSLSVIILLAVGTFTIMLTGAYRKTFYGYEHLRKSGTGGYLFWAETTSPIPFNLNSNEGKNRLIINNHSEIDGVRFLQFERHQGDEASCLNLNQVQSPQLLAVYPYAFDTAGAFSFVKLLPGIPPDHPWMGLNTSYNDSTFTAYIDQTVLQYSIHKKLGDTLIYQGESGKSLCLVLAGTLANSIFQGNVLISDSLYRQYFPSSGGSKIMLVDGPENTKQLVSGILSRSLIDYGIEISTTNQRLATFNSVENTYLTVFMALSGLGFIIGTIGLGIVLLRNVYERKQELALLVSLGFTDRKVFNVVFTENFYLLVTGFFTGLLAAFIGILPSLFSPSFNLQGGYLTVFTACIFMSGLIWIYFPLKSALNKPLTSALRND